MKTRIALIALAAFVALAACEEAEFYTAPITGPRTKDADVFARSFLDQMQARSFAANREFCGRFGRDSNGYVIATPPIQGKLDNCRPLDPGEEFNAFASYHSHGGYDALADSEVPSTSDLLADHAEKVVGYISTPGGRIWISKNKRAHQMCGLKCIRQDPAFEPETYGPVFKRYTLAQLRRRMSS